MRFYFPFLVGCFFLNLVAAAQEDADLRGDSVVVFSEIMPEYPGGLQNYLDKNLVYPKKALRREIEGKVVLQFTIETDGAVTNAQILKSSNKIFNNEALRLVKHMEKWKPATKNDKPVRLKYTWPLTFTLK